MKKNILVLLLMLLLVFSQAACRSEDAGSSDVPGSDLPVSTDSASTDSQDEPQNEPKKENVSTPYFWKVSGNGFDGAFYLLGSIHIGDENTNVYPREITDAFARCTHLAVESDVVAIENDLLLQIEMSKAIMYLDGTNITHHIDRDVYEAAQAILKENGLYNSAMDMIQPIYWMTLIENAYIAKTPYADEYGVDRYFLKAAKDEEKPILEIEDPVETYKALAALSPETQAFLLEQTADPVYLQESAEEISEMYSVWKRGDIRGSEALFTTSTEGMTKEELAAYTEYNAMLLTTRNRGMVDAAVSYLEADKEVFYVVGLAHMLGEDSLIDGLRDKGYTVTQVQYE